MIVAVGAPPSSAARQYWWRQLRWRSCCDWWRAAVLRWLGAQRAQCRHSNQASSTQHSKAAVCVSCVGDINIHNTVTVSVQCPVSPSASGPQWSRVPGQVTPALQHRSVETGHSASVARTTAVTTSRDHNNNNNSSSRGWW